MPLFIIIFCCLALSSCGFFHHEKDAANKPSSEAVASKKPLETELKAEKSTEPNKAETVKQSDIQKAKPSKTYVASPVVAKPAVSDKTPTTVKNTPHLKAKPAPIASTPVIATPTVKQPVPVKQTKTSETVLPGKLSGTLQVINGSQLMPSENALVTLTKIESTEKDKPITPKKRLINMSDKAYHPQFVLISPGDTLAFKNNDAIKHNVFSSSKNNGFDLGTYGFNRVVEHQINNEGIVKIYCNIHPEMALFVAVNKTEFKAITDSNGKFSLTNIPAGRYRLNIWHIRGEQSFNVQLASGAHIQKTFTLNTENFKPKEHLNKFGKPY